MCCVLRVCCVRAFACVRVQGLLPPGSKAIIISSQAGSVEWRSTQNANAGGDYGHHMSRAACNMAGKLLSEELKVQRPRLEAAARYS